MADFSDVPSLIGRPAPSVEEILSRDSRPVPAALRESRNDYLGDPPVGDLGRERYYSPEFQRLEAQRTWQIACRVEEK